FSSRRRHTRSKRDWSSDVCSSDLIGTSGVALSIENDSDYENDGNVHYFNHCVPNQKYIMGVTLSAGYSLEWLKQLLGPDQDFASFLKNIGDSSPGANGLMYTPYLLGE